MLGGAIIALRSPETPGTSQPPPRPAQTSVSKYAAEGVVLPEPGPKPPRPGPVVVTPGPHRLLARWDASPAPTTVAGYEVRWGRPGALNSTRLVAEPQVQLDGLDDGVTYGIEIRNVDMFGQRSAPVAVSGTPGTQPDPTAYTFVDRFDGQAVPDPTNWRFASPGACGRATRGDGSDTKRLVISANCGSASVALRARAPFKLAGGVGSVVIDTDSPSEAGQLMIDLVPGSADLIDGSPSGPPKPDKPGVAQADPALPPGTIRVLITSKPDDRSQPKPVTTVQVLTAPNVHRNGHVVSKIAPLPTPRIGENVRWQVSIGKDNISVLRNGVLVGGGDVTPAWQQATALFGFVGPSGGFRAGVAVIGFTGAPTAPPVALAAPTVRTSRTVQQTGMVLAPAPAGTMIQDVQAAQLRMSLLPQADQSIKSLDGTLSVDVGGKRVLATPAVRGQPLKRGVRYPVVALIPKEALVLSGDPQVLDVGVSSNVQQKGLATRVEFSEIELYAAPGVTPPPVAAPKDPPLPRPRPAVARAEAQMLGATGQPIPEGATAVPGRVLVDVHLNGSAAQRIAGEVAGLGGIEIRLDGRKIAAFPTTVDGPGVGGQWRLPLTTNQFGAGPHIIEVRAVGVDAETLYASTVLSFTV
ncbi:hypothetical protein EV186_101841 [Labedaea rhizosphaerae]|uniref:Fibronectin type-III domain-containing protein n=1 Tax=Labedaea rhizosphaerae TaxID=598644 RepID=A0A4R6SMT7_LABRH|nr:hypothetical protein EV186_101841 [Labedaea rhizosphaerae]